MSENNQTPTLAQDAGAQPAQNPMADSIRGYRKFNQATSDYINRVKNLGDDVDSLLNDATAASGVDADQRMVAIARTKFQEAAMWLIRAAARPDGLF